MGEHRTQFMASEDDFAAYMAAVLPKLVEVGATGAMTWCFADYVPELWDRPPCDEFKHERFFGLVRPDGSLKPHAKAIRDFAERRLDCLLVLRDVDILLHGRHIETRLQLAGLEDRQSDGGQKAPRQ